MNLKMSKVWIATIAPRLAIAGTIAMVFSPRPVTAEVSQVTVFKSGVDGYHTYRIPAIVEAANGDLLAFAEGRKNGGGDAGDIDIVLKRSNDRGKTWARC